ncbi:hypothetical protein OHS33_22485 [Streptomyces sp. NBC_00536]|uniref:hypothetical protein n=1 Tax=Streptomyces sp. NBC_00536 TaxID=2975769 RepID=UPI002E7FB88E|nr:hypothetical protein [Streptomyces sp. NBC_00536]WUC80853.1 hypothetical protein OHS33_22485 [Streptomyces sp. NBC_00536]
MIGGNYLVSEASLPAGFQVLGSLPDPDQTEWSAVVNNQSSSAVIVAAFATCVVNGS